MKVLSCNIRCFGAHDGDNGWEHRKALCARVIRSRRPDLIGFQEMWAEQFSDLSAALPEYDWFGMADMPGGRRPMNSIFYRREAFTRLSAGGYWLSETPHVPGSKSWDSSCVRLANWICLEDRHSGAAFRLVNTHLDHVSQPAREGQAGLIVADAAAYPDDYPQLLSGDMNCNEKNPAIAAFKAGGWVDSYQAQTGREDAEATFHGFLGPQATSTHGRIDWIFTRGPVRVCDTEIITDSEQGRYPSDHYFIGATVEMGTP